MWFEIDNLLKFELKEFNKILMDYFSTWAASTVGTLNNLLEKQ